MTSQRMFRFGVNTVAPDSRTRWIEKCRRAEEFGYDVTGVADHLGLAAPFPARGEKLLRVAAEHAAIIGFTGAGATADGSLRVAGIAETEQRVAYLRVLLEEWGSALPAEVADRPEELPILQIGTSEEIAERLLENRQRFGFSYITVHEDAREKFAPVIAMLRGR
ncbi:hypothetical protein D5S18_05365 [Nocardia panacis]|uniref:LLM class flavin-dependent oxidoreductase n=1 Tax=Nocardia panacis TaxID=2340916 RepID=A0A3A4K1N6_9NOCA|nr:hypothetical protein [Nocardia panacis]RJO78338.1 hypothetical protein D5S18_05365 [Nocardia panacis]